MAPSRFHPLVFFLFFVTLVVTFFYLAHLNS